MKKLLAILFAILMLLSLTACETNETQKDKKQKEVNDASTEIEFYNPEDYTETELEVIQNIEKYYLIPGAKQAFGDTCTYEGTVIKNITGAGEKYVVNGTGYALCDGKEFTCKFGYEFKKADTEYINGKKWITTVGSSEGMFNFYIERGQYLV